MTALLTIGSGSVEPPMFLDLHYCSDDSQVDPYVMIGGSEALCLETPNYEVKFS